MTPRKQLAARFKQARQDLGISQFELGVKLGIDEATAKSRVSHYETAVNVPTLEVMQEMSKALNKPMSWFFCTEDELELLQKLYMLTKSDRKKYLDQLNQILPY